MKRYRIEHVGGNYILFLLGPGEILQGGSKEFCASSRHVQPLVDLLPKEQSYLEIER